MLTELITQFNSQIQNFFYLIMIINGVLHFIFASAVARDAGNLQRIGQRPALVSAPTWAFATLIGGVFTATIYWLLHHSSLTRTSIREVRYDKPI
jgi:competence transcription factor ComK